MQVLTSLELAKQGRPLTPASRRPVLSPDPPGFGGRHVPSAFLSANPGLAPAGRSRSRRHPRAPRRTGSGGPSPRAAALKREVFRQTGSGRQLFGGRSAVPADMTRNSPPRSANGYAAVPIFATASKPNPRLRRESRPGALRNIEEVRRSAIRGSHRGRAFPCRETAPPDPQGLLGTRAGAFILSRSPLPACWKRASSMITSRVVPV